MKKILLLVSLFIMGNVYAVGAGLNTGTQQMIPLATGATTLTPLTVTCATALDMGEYFPSLGLLSSQDAATARGSIGAVGTKGSCSVGSTVGASLTVSLNGGATASTMVEDILMIDTVSINLHLEDSAGIAIPGNINSLFTSTGSDIFLIDGDIPADQNNSYTTGHYTGTTNFFVSVN